MFASIDKLSRITWEALNIVRSPILKWFLALCRLLGVCEIANSRFVGETIGQGIPVMHLSVDLSRFEHVPLDISVDARTQLIGLCLSRFVPAKGHRELLHGLARSAERDQFRVIMVDDGADPDYRAEVDGIIDALRLGESVTFVERTDRPEDLLASVHFSISLRVDPEPFGLSIIESFAVGRPVLAHALGGPEETVRDDVGWLVRNLDENIVGATFDKIWAERQMLPQMSSTCRQYAEEAFSLRAQAETYARIVRTHIGNRCPSNS